MGRRLGIGVVALLVGGGGAWYSVQTPATSVAPATRLVIEITGGFAFVPTPSQHLLEVAYLNDVQLKEGGAPVCTVDQLGHEMQILRGIIVDVDHTTNQPAPESNKFDLDRAVVEFPALASANIPLTFNRDAWGTDPPTPTGPADPDNESHWHNLRYVPSILRAGQHALRKDWQEVVNGRLVLQGGDVRGTFPSDPAMKRAKFEFRENGTPRFTMSVIDKVIYTVDVPGTTIELLFGNNATQGYRRLEIAPQGNMVRLAVRGIHADDDGLTLGMTRELTDHCAFYSLLQKVPPSSTWLRPFYISNQLLANGDPQPSPGFYCNPDWF
jgi:hypothetical protein